jgi:hypothetical protein
MPAFIIFEKTNSYIDSKGQDDKSHYIMASILVSTNIINQWMYINSVLKGYNHGHQTTSQSH